MVVLTLSLTTALGAGLEVVPDLGPGPGVAARGGIAARAVFDGPPGTIEVRVGERWAPVASGPSPLPLGRVSPGAALRLVRGGEVIPAEPGLAWSPADVAAWSGEGLRGALVTGLAPVGGLWAATAGGGLARWDGEAWSHLGRRQGVPERLWSLSVTDRTRWLAHDGGVTRIAPDGGMLHHALPGRVSDVLGLDGDHAYAVSREAVYRLEVEGDALVGRELAKASGCVRLARAGDLVVAGCDPALRLDGHASGVAALPSGIRALLPRVGGWWAASQAGLVAVVDGERVPHGLLGDVPVVDLARLGDGMIVAAGHGGAWHVSPERSVQLAAAGGLPSGTALRVAEGPSYGKAWVGTARGVALANAANTATPLPLAPLPAGTAVRAVHDLGARGAVAADEDGLAWIGPRPPRGFDALRAAVVQPVIAVDGAGRDLWVLTVQAAWRLDASGRLTRWDLGDLGTSLTAAPGRVVVGTPSGVQWWLEGARMLGPVQPVDPASPTAPGDRSESPVDLAFGPDGALWIATAERVVRRTAGGGVQSWTPGGVVRAVAPSGPGAVVATDAGIAWVAAGSSSIGRGWPGVATGPVRAIAAEGGHVWALGDDGTLWRDGERHRVLEAASSLATARGGVWVGTGNGLWRIAR